MTTAEQHIQFNRELSDPVIRTPGVETLNPFKSERTRKLSELFFEKYYSDNHKRHAVIGINPGRLGAGVTGVGFTDPVNLEVECGITNDLDKKHELSSRFFYEVVDAFGGASKFFAKFLVTSVVPLGFVKDGKNLNYYDIASLQDELLPYIKSSFEKQLPYLNSDVAFCIGKGKNQKFLERLNKEEGYFNRIEVLPHPRWVMQYRLKRKQEFIDEYLQKLSEV
jgi:hypothetical protein